MGRRGIYLFLLSAATLLFLLAQDRGPKEGEPAEVNNCIACHTNAGKLITLLKERQSPASSDQGGGCAVAPSRSAFLNYFVNKDFSTSLHGSLGCTQCHGGEMNAEQPELAHRGMQDPEANCANCHADIVKHYATSLHATLAGQDRLLRLRSKREENFLALEPVRRNDCNTCHAGCGDCHINIPKSVGGGLISGHNFFKTPPMEDTCAVCHGSRAGGEYVGTLSDELPADAHYRASMSCIDCHKEPMHGDGHSYDNRWQVAGLPDCVDCHAALPNSSAPAHQLERHGAVSCQVCHSVAYKNCFNCHASIDEGGAYHRVPRQKTIAIKIGRNTEPSYRYDYVPLRHNPVARDAFDQFGQNLLPHFDEYPTWKTAAPHNIQRVTPQNQSCDACHANDALFLSEEDLDPNDSRANERVLLKERSKF